MDNTALELTSAILWTVGVVGLPAICLLIAGAINVFVLGNTAGKLLDSDDPFAGATSAGKKGALILLVGLLIGLILGIIALFQAVNAWVLFAS